MTHAGINRKQIGWQMICLLCSLIVLLLFASRTSPLYSLLLGDYGGNPASAAMLAGKSWLQGMIPYRDLFLMEAPLYLLIQAAGWAIGGRTGIFILEVISFTVFLIFLQKLLGLFLSFRASCIWTLSAVVPYAAFCCGGNSSMEWCLPLIVSGLYLTAEMLYDDSLREGKIMITGILCGLTLMISPSGGGLLYGAVLYLLWRCVKQRDGGAFIKKIAVFVLGIAIPAVPVIVYFLIVQGLVPMLQGMIVYPVKDVASGFSSITIIVHKAVKCCLLIPLFAAGICLRFRKDGKMGSCMIWASLAAAVFMMLGDNSWYCFVSVIPGILMGAALFQSDMMCRKKSIGQLAVICSVLMTLAICFVPFINYLSYLLDGVPEVVEEFCGDFQEVREESEDYKIITLNTDSSYFLYLDEKPLCRYFTDQEKLSALDSRIADEVESYTDSRSGADILITTERGWVGQDLEGYLLVQVYCKKGGNLCIYVAD